MKLEQISDNQIRCMLTKNDLAQRQLKISELAYGSARARKLFQEMMHRASDELGFETDNEPLLIEAVPFSDECIILLITRVEDPEEIDTRFARFTPAPEDAQAADESPDNMYADVLRQLSSNIVTGKPFVPDSMKNSVRQQAEPKSERPESRPDTEQTGREGSTLLRIYSFYSMEEISRLAQLVPEDSGFESVIYRNDAAGIYYLILSSGQPGSPAFYAASAAASEFGRPVRASRNTLYYYDEHYTMMIRSRALQILRSL